MAKRVFSIGILALLVVGTVQMAFTHRGALHMQEEQTVLKNIMLNKSCLKHAFEK